MQSVHISQTASGLLEVGLEQERELAASFPPVTRGICELLEPAPRISTPAGKDGLPQLCGQRVVTGDMASIEQAERRFEVCGSDGGRLCDGAYGVIEPDAGVPQRIPEAIRDRLDVVVAPV